MTRGLEKTHIATNATTTIFTGHSGRLESVTVNTTAAGAITISDKDIVVAVLKASVAEGTYWYNVTMASGLIITTAAASDITVAWEKY